MQFSSGTTGAKKGVKISANSLINQICNYNLHVKLKSKKSKVISWLPLYHDMGLIACMMMPLFTKINISMSPFEWVANLKYF